MSQVTAQRLQCADNSAPIRVAVHEFLTGRRTSRELPLSRARAGQARGGVSGCSQNERFAMEVSFYKYAFFILMGIAALGLLGIVSMFASVVLRATWSWLRAHWKPTIKPA